MLLALFHRWNICCFLEEISKGLFLVRKHRLGSFLGRCRKIQEALFPYDVLFDLSLIHI